MSYNLFQINFSSPSNPSHGFITINGKKVFPIINEEEFYEALGYSDEIRRNGLMEDEFLWHEYRKSNCNKSEVCLQARIIEYLSEHSATFAQEYADQCTYWIYRCTEHRFAALPMCSDCVLNPRQRCSKSLSIEARR